MAEDATVPSVPAKEPFYKSRRIWAMILTIAGVVCVNYFPAQADKFITIVGSLASALGLSSYIAPKQ